MESTGRSAKTDPSIGEMHLRVDKAGTPAGAEANQQAIVLT
jgi:hypothetical protein